jgi:type VI secretion system protein ImpH
MGVRVGRETDALAFFRALAESPYRYDFYQTLRRLECLYDGKPRWGEALRPVDEPVRLGQDPDLSFAPAPLASFEADGGKTPRLQVRLFGLFGPNGPLPLHITE